MVSNNPYDQYKKQSLSTLAPGELLVRLFDELIKQCRLAVIHIQKKEYGAANDSLTKGQTIVTTLVTSLDMRFPISNELREMYLFLVKELLRANVQKNPKVIEAILPIIKDLRDSFEQAEKLSRQSQNPTVAPIATTVGGAVGGKAV